jgi:SAM-dependent methyltransferase
MRTQLTEHNKLYRQADYYDIVFNRDVSPEVDFIAELYRRLTGRDIESVLELGCGPGYHARSFARRGVRAVGLDLREEMIGVARDQATGQSGSLEWLVGDMRDFRLTKPVSVVLSMFDSVDCLLTNEEIIRHLRAVAANLEPGGMYFLEFAHTRDCSSVSYRDFKYHGERNGCEVTITWTPRLPADTLTGIVESEVQMYVRENASSRVFSHYTSERMLLPQEIRALVDLSGAFTICGWYGDFNVNQPFDNTPASRQMIVVLQKRGTPTGSESQYCSPRLEARLNPAKGGHSVYAREHIRAGELLVIYAGRIVSTEMLPPPEQRKHRQPLQIEEDLYIIPDNSSELAEYLSHSCEPNAGLSGQIALVALRDIAPGEEVCYDYAMTDGSPYDEFDCMCGATCCRKRVTGDDWRRPDLQARYAGHFSPYLQRRMARSAKSVIGTTDNVVGRQFICDYWGCQGNIDSSETVLEVLKEAVPCSRNRCHPRRFYRSHRACRALVRGPVLRGLPAHAAPAWNLCDAMRLTVPVSKRRPRCSTSPGRDLRRREALSRLHAHISIRALVVCDGKRRTAEAIS